MNEQTEWKKRINGYHWLFLNCVSVVVHSYRIDFIYFLQMLMPQIAFVCLYFDSTYWHSAFYFIFTVRDLLFYSLSAQLLLFRMCVVCVCSFFLSIYFIFPFFSTKFIVSVYLWLLLLLLFSFLFSFVFHEKWRTHQNHFTPNNIVELVLSVFMVMMMIPIRCSTDYTQYSHPSIHTNHQRKIEYSGNGVIGSTAPRKINKCTVKMHKSMLKHTAKE